MQIYINQSICLLFIHHLHRIEACACHYPVPGKHCCHWNVCHYVHLVIFMSMQLILVRTGKNYMSSQEYVGSISPSLCNVNKLNYLNFSYCHCIIPKCDNCFFQCCLQLVLYVSQQSQRAMPIPPEAVGTEQSIKKLVLSYIIQLFKWHSALNYWQAEQSHIPFIIR